MIFTSTASEALSLSIEASKLFPQNYLHRHLLCMWVLSFCPPSCTWLPSFKAVKFIFISSICFGCDGTANKRLLGGLLMKFYPKTNLLHSHNNDLNGGFIHVFQPLVNWCKFWRAGYHSIFYNGIRTGILYDIWGLNTFLTATCYDFSVRFQIVCFRSCSFTCVAFKSIPNKLLCVEGKSSNYGFNVVNCQTIVPPAIWTESNDNSIDYLELLD